VQIFVNLKSQINRHTQTQRERYSNISRLTE